MAYTVTQTANYLSFGSITYSFVANDGATVIGTMSLGADYTVTGAGDVTIVNPAMHGVSAEVTYQYRNSTIVTTALDDLGLSFIPGAVGQSAWSGLAAYGAQSIGYSGQAQIAGTQYDLGTNAQVENHMVEVVSTFAYHLGSSVPDIDPSLFLHEVLANTRQGVNFPSALFDGSSDWSDYCVANDLLVSPAMISQVSGFDLVALVCQLTNSQPVWSGGRLKIIPYGDASASGNGRTYTPDTTPIYDLTDEYWKGDSQTEPLKYEIKAPSDRYNHVRIEYLDRSQQYAATVAEARDLTDISANGLRSKDVISAHWICDGDVARQVAQLVMQRSLFVTTTYSFTLPQNYVFLEPMDLVTLTDPILGMDRLPVRITEMAEGEDGTFDVVCEDYPPGVCSAALYSSQALGGYLHDMAVPPGNIDIPVIWEVPANLLPGGTALELYTAARGVDTANWGGCDVWVSMDGNNYLALDRIYGGSRYGKLTGTVVTTADFNQVTTGQFLSGSANDAASLATLCYIAGSSPEYISYQNATLTGTGAYSLDGLIRGVYGSSGNTHTAGDYLVRVDDRVARSGPLNGALVGQTVYLKFTSFNVYGRSEQSLTDVNPYTYTVVGTEGPQNLIPFYASTILEHSAGNSSAAVAELEFFDNGRMTYLVSATNFGSSPPVAQGQPYWLPSGNFDHIVWARVTHISGDALAAGSPPTGTWVEMNGPPLAWELLLVSNSPTPVSKKCDLKIEIATDSAGANIVCSTTGTLFVEVIQSP